MTKAAFVSSCGDPFILLLSYKLFKERWYDEVDKFYVNINNHCGVPVEAEAELLQKLALDPKVHIIYHPRGIGNGMPITELTKICTEDLVLLLEDDFFIFDSGAVSKCFQAIESDLTDVVGSPRFSCGTEIGEASKEKYHLDYSGYGDVGPNFWPTGFFCKRSDLLKTDLNFASVTFKPGDYCKELDYTFKEINHSDTFGWACMQLRAMGLRFQSVPSHKAGVFEIQEKEAKEQNWHPTQSWFPWIHGGSLSAGWGGYLSDRVPDTSTDSAKQEIESRVAFWQIASDVVQGFDDFKDQYKMGIFNLITNANLDPTRINQKYNLYKNLLRV